MNRKFLPKSIKTYVLLFLLTLGCIGTRAQVTTASTYSFQAFSGTYTPLVGGTASGSNVLQDDNVQTSIPIGFTFTFCGVNYTQVSACSNGWVSLGNSNIYYYYPGSTYNIQYTNQGNSPVNLVNGYYQGGLLFWAWCDLYGAGGTPSSTYSTTGAVGSRVFTIEFKNWEFYNQQTPIFSCQVKLFEGTNVIQYIYNDIAPLTAGVTFPIGIANSQIDYKSLNNGSASPTASSTTFTNFSQIPASGQVYQFAPPAPCSGTPQAPTITTTFATPVCSGYSTTLALYDPNITTNIHYVWQVGPSLSGPWTNIAGAPDATSYTTPGLVATGYYRVGDSCGNSLQITYSNPITVPVNVYSIPYTEYFNTTPNTQIPTCFSENVTSSLQSKWGTNIVFRDANGTAYPSVVSEDDKQGNYQSGKNAFFTLPALPLNAGETYRIRFGYERGRADYLTTNVAPVYPENLYLYENYAVQPSIAGNGVPGGTAATSLFSNVVTVDGHQTASLTFTPPASGAYYFSWYSNTPHPAGGVLIAGGLIAVDSIKIDSFGCTPPNITFQPQNSAVCLNGTTSLS
ncbi:MAG: hypothetical protein P4L41_18985, partial [Flavipsychrobacter sp.]|nr:hypothetical protein [Flavipsychrobacter sp.]